MSDKRTLRNFINGESVESAEGRTSDLVDPSTGEVFGTAPVSGAEDVDRAYAAAAAAFENPPLKRVFAAQLAPPLVL